VKTIYVHLYCSETLKTHIIGILQSTYLMMISSFEKKMLNCIWAYCTARTVWFLWVKTVSFCGYFHCGPNTVRISWESPCGGCRLWCGSGGNCSGGWTKGLLLVENSMTHQGVTLLHTDWKHQAVESRV
jgi:hypothetical protein